MVAADGGALDGLVLLDLPDHDSVQLEHRLEVDRLVELVDVLVWVLDPQKYADAAVHDRYLAPLADHAGVLLVVLNQVDRLDEAAAAACRADLRRLLDGEGLTDTPVLSLSARTGTGLPELRALLERRVARRRAATDRLTADVRTAAAALAAHCGSEGGAAPARPPADLVEALGDAAGVPAVTSAVERSARRDGRRPHRLAAAALDPSAATGPAAPAAPRRRGGADLAARARCGRPGGHQHGAPAGPRPRRRGAVPGLAGRPAAHGRSVGGAAGRPPGPGGRRHRPRTRRGCRCGSAASAACSGCCC